jgi:Glycosyl transferases group 1
MLILCLCPEFYHWKLIPGYAAGLRRRGVAFHCVSDKLPANIELEKVMEKCPAEPAYVFHFESALPLLPRGLEKSRIPTVCFHADTYAYTKRRIRWSYLFDHVAVFHPGYEERFARAGHPGAFLLPHAVRREFYDLPEMEREYEIGWVGQTQGASYLRRGECLPKLARKFHTNDWGRKYTLEEVAQVYRRSQVVVNIGRDDFPQDANLRVFEALASGALLVTSIPTELTELGFVEGEHFVAYRQEGEIVPLVEKYLSDYSARRQISEAAREKVLREHTYDARVDTLLRRLEAAGDAKLAPARNWPIARARLMALDFYASQGLLQPVGSEYGRIAGRGIRETVDGGILVGKALIKYYSMHR